MSCNGCRVLRKGCSESCVLRPCLQWIDGADAQGHATVFVAKFFGRAGLMSFITAVPPPRRPALFQSLLYEACGRTINPVGGAVGLLWKEKWDLCEAAVGTVLRGGALQPLEEFAGGEVTDAGELCVRRCSSTFSSAKKRKLDVEKHSDVCDLELCLTPRSLRPGTPNSEEESVTTTSEGRPPAADAAADGHPRLLKLFV